MTLVKDIVKIMEKLAPKKLAEEWDNSGLQTGRLNHSVTKVLFALDLTKNVIEQAKKNKAEMIITHHPIIFKKISSITDAAWQSDLLLQCAELGIAVFSAHTNWDVVEGGVNDILAEKLELKKIKILDKDSGLGRIGEIKLTTLNEFVSKVKEVLLLDKIVVASAGKKVHKVAVCGGAGAEYMEHALALGCDTFVTGDIKYHEAQSGVFRGLNLIDGTHQGTEILSMEVMQKQFAKLCKIPTILAEETKIMKVM